MYFKNELFGLERFGLARFGLERFGLERVYCILLNELTNWSVTGHICMENVFIAG